MPHLAAQCENSSLRPLDSTIPPKSHLSRRLFRSVSHDYPVTSQRGNSLDSQSRENHPRNVLQTVPRDRPTPCANGDHGRLSPARCRVFRGNGTEASVSTVESQFPPARSYVVGATAGRGALESRESAYRRGPRYRPPLRGIAPRTIIRGRNAILMLAGRTSSAEPRRAVGNARRKSRASISPP